MACTQSGRAVERTGSRERNASAVGRLDRCNHPPMLASAGAVRSGFSTSGMSFTTNGSDRGVWRGPSVGDGPRRMRRPTCSLDVRTCNAIQRARPPSGNARCSNCPSARSPCTYSRDVHTSLLVHLIRLLRSIPHARQAGQLLYSWSNHVHFTSDCLAPGAAEPTLHGPSRC